MARAPQPANLRATRPISAAFWPFYPDCLAYALENADKRGNSPWTCNTNSRQAASTDDMREAPSAVTGERRFKLKPTPLRLLFDVHTGKVRQHGSPTRIQSWITTPAAACVRAGAQQEANDIVVVSGPLPVDELNKCLWVSGYVRRMFSDWPRCRTASCSGLQSRFARRPDYGPHSPSKRSQSGSLLCPAQAFKAPAPPSAPPREQQASRRVLAARSALVSTLSRWSTSPDTTATSQVPHRPSPQSQGTSTPTACRCLQQGAVGRHRHLRPESFSTATKRAPCRAAGPSLRR